MKLFVNLINVIFNDSAEPWQLGFQDSASPIFTGIEILHNTIGFYLIFILVSVLWVAFSIIYYFDKNNNAIPYKYFTHGSIIELIWTVSPAFLLIAIAFPSFRLLYIMDEVLSPTLTIKAVGFQIDGLKSLIFSKIKDTYDFLSSKTILLNSFLIVIGQKNINIINKNSYKIGIKYTIDNNSKNSIIKLSFFHTRCKAVNRIGPHNQDVISVIFGLLLGDGYGNRLTGEGVRICIRQSIIHKEYLLFLYDFFYSRGYCSSLKPREYTRTIFNFNKIYKGYEFNTYTFRSFNWIYDLFYKKGKKIVPLFNQETEIYFTPLTLAILICDDGGWAKPGVRISCNNFTLEEVERLKYLFLKETNSY